MLQNLKTILHLVYYFLGEIFMLARASETEISYFALAIVGVEPVRQPGFINKQKLQGLL